MSLALSLSILEYEKPAYEHGRRRIVANKFIPSGSILTQDMITCKRNNQANGRMGEGYDFYTREGSF